MEQNLHELSRAELVLGAEKIERLKGAHVAVFGIGGVGSYVVEALARGGIGHLTIVDGDSVSLTNINRQLVALHSTIGKMKADVMAERIRDMMPETEVVAVNTFYTPENKEIFDFSQFDYVVDAVDMVTAKLLLITSCKEVNTPIISCMGTGNKLDPTKFQVADITKTSVCPLAKVMRKELKVRGIKGVKVVYSTELPRTPLASDEVGKRQIPGSLSFVPPVAGMILAGEVIKEICGEV
ncbi:tRNA threonylcarbamoyladenosine dehydratase [Chakrabartyella piscis]|uniref:tRNA threonylcarbamoyladenosine dehydratase n=1 Tax=Chakrabartyella piscis TaxID=2918914 RepID=UPI00295871E4|nr:tRNA threonylcarbamoyladenosine dehydratase [Chakrabartyella piscis]